MYLAFPAGGYGPTTIVSDLEAQGAPHGALLRSLDAVSALLTLLLVPFLWRALPPGVWRRVAVGSLAVFGVFGVPAGLIPLPCAEGTPGCSGDPTGLQSVAHDATSIASTVGLIASAAATALAVRRAGPRWLCRAGWITVAVQVVSGLLVGAGEVRDGLEDLAGLAQRVEIAGIGAWIVCVAVYIAAPAAQAGRPRADISGTGA